MATEIFRHTFVESGEFEATHLAESVLKAAGFSYGRMQAREPRGLLFGDYDIQKWRNLRPADRAGLHGELRGSPRNGPVTIALFTSCPASALSRMRWAVKNASRQTA